MPFKNIGTNLSINACGSRCIARCSTSIQVICRSGASKVCKALHQILGRCQIVVHFQQVLNPAQFSPRVMSSLLQTPPVQCRVFPLRLLYFFWCSGLYGRVLPVAGAPAHMTRFLKIRSIVSRILMFSPFGSLLESVNVSREILTTPLLGHVNRCQRGNHTVL